MRMKCIVNEMICKETVCVCVYRVQVHIVYPPTSSREWEKIEAKIVFFFSSSVSISLINNKNR